MKILRFDWFRPPSLSPSGDEIKADGDQSDVLGAGRLRRTEKVRSRAGCVGGVGVGGL